MAHVLVLPSVLGVRAGVHDAVARLEAAGHAVHVADFHRGRAFDSYPDARAAAGELGDEELDRRAVEAAAGLPDDLVVIGFSLGAVLAQRVVLDRAVAGAVLFSGGLPVRALGAHEWPRSAPLQMHVADGDPLRDPARLDELLADARRAGASAARFDYADGGHLFTDPALPDEYSADSASLAWRRVLGFIEDATG